ncbi:hypothetical protein Lal_00044668 [Lupinus albus]|uniref:Uncharacterized protein n=1 Tax=Lupinus albus TaxID=3870 RepID=A0A6A5LH00_LUPAL|nr:hypothetical protein Lalb_Chr24g0402271 [Lupinus albus]KAF1858635.1 hypothetical protein Lal_00044668 [Lupinus albus]
MSLASAVVRISPYTFSAIAVSIGVSVLGAACVIFCEAVAIYGVIVAIILQTKLESVSSSNCYAKLEGRDLRI